MAQHFIPDRFQPLPGPSRRDRIFRPSSFGAAPRPRWTRNTAPLPAAVPAAMRVAYPTAPLLDPHDAWGVLLTLATIIEARDPYMSGHSQRTGWMAARLARRIGLGEPDVETLYLAGILHDIGKLGVPEAVLNKPGPLSPAEMELIQRHPRIGCEMLRPVAWLAPVLPAVLHHHEDFDGSGYPEGLRGGQIPLAARILRIVDIYDALTSPRPYRAALSPRAACCVLLAGSGTITDPTLTRDFLTLLEHSDAQPRPLVAV